MDPAIVQPKPFESEAGPAHLGLDDSAAAVEKLAYVRKPSERIALYIHIPFCLSKCIYCDFNTYEGIEQLIPSLVSALEREIVFRANRLNSPTVSSIFFGGGTPSYIPAESIQRLLTSVFSNYMVEGGAEITLEANPDDVHEEKLALWRAAGVNRLSIGVQSFDDDTLKELSRRHDAGAAIKAVHEARRTDFDNINIDLMFGLPAQSLENWHASLIQAISLEVEHTSLYGLQIETGTPLHRNVALGKTLKPDDDLAADMYEFAMDTLADAGYHQYEISNWAKPGKESQHNLAYWLNQPYLGIGPGAHSSLRGTRFANLKSPRRYIDAFSSCNVSKRHPNDAGPDFKMPIEFCETTSKTMAISETMMMGLRLERGVTFAEFNSRFGASMEQVYADEMEALVNLGLIEKTHDRIKLTRQGKLLGNEVFERFILSEKG